MTKFYIVWNEGRSEGFITDDKADAVAAQERHRRTVSSALGEAVIYLYDYGPLYLQEVEIDTPPGGGGKVIVEQW